MVLLVKIMRSPINLIPYFLNESNLVTNLQIYWIHCIMEFVYKKN